MMRIVLNIGAANHVPVKYSDIIIKIFHWNIKIWLYSELRSFYIDSFLTPSHLYGTFTDLRGLILIRFSYILLASCSCLAVSCSLLVKFAEMQSKGSLKL